jgi:hypothetical protein
MNFLTRLFNRRPVAPLPPTAPPASDKAATGPFQRPTGEDITLIDPVANDAWQAGVYTARMKDSTSASEQKPDS